MRVVECRVSQEYIEGGGVVIGAVGSHNDVALQLRFDDMWTGLNIYATFTDALGEQSGVILLTPSMLVSGEAMTYDVPIPAVAKRFAGKSMLTLSGFSIVDGTEKDRATNTATAYFRVLKSDYRLLEGSKISPTIEEQIFKEINSLGEKVEETETDLVELREGIQDNADKVSELEEKVEGAEAVASDAANEAANATYTANRAKEIADEVKARADRGEFKGEKGDPYALTSADISMLVSATVNALPKYRGEAVDA